MIAIGTRFESKPTQGLISVTTTVFRGLGRSALPQVAVTVINAGCYLVVLGLAYASQDPALIRRLWRPSYRAWFPKGSDDREATVLRMVINKVNYWEPPRCRLRRLFQAVTAVATRQPVETPMKTIEPW